MFKILLSILIVYFCLCILLYLFQERLTYFPSRRVISPEQAGLPDMKVIELTTEDHLSIHSWYRPALGENQPTIVYFHGNAGNIADRSFIIEPFLNKGFGVLLLTYRGYSGNPGNPNEKGLYMDARAAIKFLIKNEVPANKIVLIGESIGSAVAIQMGTEFPVGAIILQAPFSSLIDVAKIHYGFFLPILWVMRDQYDSMSKVNAIKSPILIIHGKQDIIIPPELSQKLFDTLPYPKEALYIQESGHNDLYEPQAIIDFIHRYIK